MSEEPHHLPTGRVTAEMIEEIVRRILSVARPERVIIFGSAATGEMTLDSDINLLVVERDVEDIRQEVGRIRRALVGVPSPFDVMVMKSERFEETRDVVGGIAWPAARYGKVIYEAA